MVSTPLVDPSMKLIYAILTNLPRSLMLPRLKLKRGFPMRHIAPSSIASLRVIRLLEPADSYVTITDPCIVQLMSKYFEEADEKSSKVLSEYPRDVYSEALEPSTFDLEKDEARAIIKHLSWAEPASGVYGPSIVRHEGKYYKIWIALRPCG